MCVGEGMRELMRGRCSFVRLCSSAGDGAEAAGVRMPCVSREAEPVGSGGCASEPSGGAAGQSTPCLATKPSTPGQGAASRLSTPSTSALSSCVYTRGHVWPLLLGVRLQASLTRRGNQGEMIEMVVRG